MLPMSSDNWAMASQANARIEASISSAVSWSCGCGSDMITRDSSSTQDEKLSLGFRDIASGPRCQRPGLCWILKRYLRVLSLILNNLGLVTSAKLRCPSIATRGWWSVVTMRDGQPRINILHFSKLQAIAVASPSIGAYRLSAGVQKRLPANTNFQASGQHTGAFLVSHWQYCWSRRNPMPVWLQSGARQVFLFMSKAEIPSRTRERICSLDLANVSSNWSSQ